MIEHRAAAGVVAPDVKFQVDVMPRLINPISQGWEKLIAIDQEPRFFGGGNGEFVEPGEKIDDRRAAIARRALRCAR
jgi:hypothetical protein